MEKTINKKAKEKQPFIYNFARVVCVPLFRILYRCEFNNKFNIPLEGGYIVACNHQSYTDPVLLSMGQKRLIHFIAKEELFRNRFFSALIRSLGAIPIHRGGTGDETAINSAEQVLSDGKLLGIFPEGKRSLNGELLKMRAGAVMLAYQSDVPIVPACITAKGGRTKMFHKVRISFGDPVTPAQLGVTTGSGKELRAATKLLAQKIAELREKDRF